MNKALSITLIYIGLVLLNIVLSRVLYITIQPRSMETMQILRMGSFGISLIPLVFLLYVVAKKVQEYPLLIVFVVLSIVQSIERFMNIVVGQHSFFVYQAFQLMSIGLIFLTLVVGIIFLVTKSWPKIVSFVLFASILGRLFFTFQYFFLNRFFDAFDFINVFSFFTSVFSLLSLVLTATMIYVLYYEQEEVKKVSYEEGYY